MRYKRVPAVRKRERKKAGKKYSRQCAASHRKTEMEEERETRSGERVSFPRGACARSSGFPSPSTRHSYPPRRPPLGSYGAGEGRMRDARNASHSFCRAVRAHVHRRVPRSLLSSFALRISRSRVPERSRIVRSLAE